MTLRIITGTIIDARDPFMVMHSLYKRGIFVRWRLTEHGWERTPTRVISGIETGNKFSIIQTTGSGKTILAVLYAFQAHQRGVRVGGNLSLRWSKNNEGKDKKEWRPAITCMEDLQKAVFMHITLDDIKGTIKAWNASEADMVTEMANASRKNMDWVDVTTQRLKFVPPDMRDITDEIIVPFIRVLDMTRKAPDGRPVPLEIVVFRFSAGKELLSYGIYNLCGETGVYILDSYNTLQIAEKLKPGESKPIDQPEKKERRPGYDLEERVFNDLHRFSGTIRWLSIEKPQKEGHETDIIFQNGSLYYIDPVSCYMHGNRPELNTCKKDFNSYDYSKKEPVRLLAYEEKSKIYYIEYKHLVGHSGNIRLSVELRKKAHPGEHYFTPLS